MVQNCVAQMGLGSEQNWRKYWTSRIDPNDPVFDTPGDNSMCIRMAFNDPKVIGYIRDNP